MDKIPSTMDDYTKVIKQVIARAFSSMANKDKNHSNIFSFDIMKILQDQSSVRTKLLDAW